MDNKKYNYEIIIKREAKVTNGLEEGRQMSGMTIEFGAENDPMIFDENGQLTMFGFKVAVNSLVGAISEYSRAITQYGGSEGEVIKDAINQLKKNLISVERKPPKTKSVRTKHYPRDKPKGW